MGFFDVRGSLDELPGREWGRVIMTIICADPSPVSLLVLRKKVKKILPDSDVHICRYADSAIRLAEKNGCDVLITEIDFGRDKGEGVNLVKEIKKLLPNVNIIFATAASYNEYAALTIPIKFSGYLIKPYLTEDLKKELQELRFRENQGSIPMNRPVVSAT